MISVKLAISQTPANTARLWAWASTSDGVPVYFHSLRWDPYSLRLLMEGWFRLSRPGCLVLHHPKTVTNPATNRASYIVTTMWIEFSALPQSQTSNKTSTYFCWFLSSDGIVRTHASLITSWLILLSLLLLLLSFGIVIFATKCVEWGVKPYYTYTYMRNKMVNKQRLKPE